MRKMRLALGLAASAAGVAGFSSVALAAGTVTPNTGLTTSTTSVTVNWSALTANSIVSIQQCWKNDADLTFNPALDCSQSTGENPPSGVSGAGTFQFGIFHGADPNLQEWGCGPTTPVGIPTTNTCYIRLADVSPANTTSDIFLPIGFVEDTGNQVPEVPLNVLLPLGAAAVLGGAFVIARKRQASAV